MLQKVYGVDPAEERRHSPPVVLSTSHGGQENHATAVALHYMHYNFVRIHRTLRVTPAMQAGLTDRLWSIEDIVRLLEAAEHEPAA
jgi:hypothetical protein